MKELKGCGISLKCLASPLDPNSPEVIKAPSHRSGQQTLLSALDKRQNTGMCGLAVVLR